MTPEALEQLRAALRPIAAGEAPPANLLAEYCNYYGLDFAARPGLEHHLGTVASSGFDLAVQYWIQPASSRNLVLLHGYFDHVGLYGKLIGHALQRGCNVLAFDLPGHGLSSGRAAAIDDFNQYGDSLAAVLDARLLPALPAWVMAQSTGAAALVNFARRYSWPFADTVLLAPLLRPQHWQRVRLAHALLHRLVPAVPRRFAVNSSDADFLAFLQRDPLQPRQIPVCWVGALRRWLAALPLQELGVGPALIVQGDADNTVDWRYNLPQMGRLFPGCRIELVPGAGHHLANESAPLRARYLAEVDRYIGLVPAPCGAQFTAPA